MTQETRNINSGDVNMLGMHQVSSNFIITYLCIVGKLWFNRRDEHLDPYPYFTTISISIYSELLNLTKRGSYVE